MADLIWQPGAEWMAEARISRFIRRCEASGLAELKAKAAADPAWFWEQVVADLGIEWFQPPAQTLDLSGGVPWAAWFRGARINLAHECVDKHVKGHRRHKLAVVYEGEEGAVRSWTYRDLWIESNRLANGLRALGVGRGDRVGIFLPMIPETVAAIMAVAKLGAIIIPIFSGFAPARQHC